MKTATAKDRSSWFLLSSFIALAGFSVLLLLMVSPPVDVSAHIGVPFGPGCGMAVVDGVVNQGEWSTASAQSFTMVSPGGAPPFSATLYVMNSANNLYLGITINDDEFSTYAEFLQGGDGFRIDFDNDNSGTLFTLNDDALVIAAAAPHFYDDYLYNPAGPSITSDTDGGGTLDGVGSASRLGDLNHFELKHPLCSGDALDFCLQPGDTVGFRLEYLDAQANGTFGSSQFFPGTSDTSEADILIAQCSISELVLHLPLLLR